MHPIFDALDSETIQAALSERHRDLLRHLSLLKSTDSTSLALQRLPVAEQHGHVILADEQTAGRGRRGRTWFSPAGQNIYMSLGWRFSCSAGNLVTLPLAVAVVVCRALQRIGVTQLGIKWPNDILVSHRKLGGILVDLNTGDAGASVVIGVGLNVGMPEDAVAGNAIDQPWCDVYSALGQPLDVGLRNRLASFLLDELLGCVDQFPCDGFEHYRADWERLDALHGKTVLITAGTVQHTGVSLGIGANGGLRVACSTGPGSEDVREYYAGDVSVKPGSVR